MQIRWITVGQRGHPPASAAPAPPEEPPGV
jgi:hypothetical protein